MRPFHLVKSAAVALLMAACAADAGDTSSETASHGDSDADSDVDSDADSDVDSDADTDVPVAVAEDDVMRYQRYNFHVSGTGTFTSDRNGLDGIIEFLTDLEGTPACDATIAYSGTPYTGTCEDCEWAFSVTGMVIRNDSVTDCYLYPPLTFVADTAYQDLFLAFAPDWTYDGTFAYTQYYDLLEVGSADTPSAFYLSYEGSSAGTFFQKGDQIDWTFQGYELHYDSYNPFFTYCGEISDSQASSSYGGEGATSSIDCAGYVTDVWSFEATEGETIQITVDTVAADTAFDPWFFVNDPNRCTILYADDNFRCTFDPLYYECPSGTIEAESTGTYEVEVHSMGACTGKTAAYSLGVVSKGW